MAKVLIKKTRQVSESEEVLIHILNTHTDTVRERERLKLAIQRYGLLCVIEAVEN